MMNFEVEELKPVLIRGNFDEMQDALANMMQAYAGLEVTEDNIPERKKDVATLRKMKTAIDDKRKAVKKEYEKPLKMFEGKCKELTGIIDAEISRINLGLAEYEQKRIDEKRLLICNLYDEHIGEYGEYIPLSKVYDPKWENKTCSEKEIVADIQSRKLSVKQDIQTINIAAGEFIDEVLEHYKKTGCNLPAAMQRLEDLRSAKERAEAVLRAEKNFDDEVRKESTKTEQSGQNEREKWTFSVFSVEDANSVRAYLEMFEIKYMEGYIK